jgi:uncharacterized protein (DUF2062 family)
MASSFEDPGAAGVFNHDELGRIVTARNPVPRRSHSAFVRLRLLIPIFRSQNPPEYTARGVAIGVFWGVTPFLGVQTLLMIATWHLMRRVFHRDSSLLQALAWSWINNPLTIVPMYYAFYVTGLWLAGHSAPADGYEAFTAMWEESRRYPAIDRAGILAEQLGAAVLVGCVPYALLGSWAAYRWALRVVGTRQERIRRRGRERRAPRSRAPRT